MTQTEPTRILIVDDHPMIRHGLVAMIATEPGFLCVGEAGNGADGVALAVSERADVVLMDLIMPRMDGIAAIEALSRARPEAKAIVLTTLVDPHEVQHALRMGAHGYVSKTASAEELITVIRGVDAGRRLMSPDVTDMMIRAGQASTPGTDLTERERDVLRAMARGLTNQAIASELGISVPTIKFHITNILGKLQVGNRTEAVLLAMKHRIVPTR